MNYNDLKEVIKNENINSSYLFLGEEDYLMNEGIDMVKEQYVEDSLDAINFSIIEGRVSDFNDLINNCETLPFMSSKRIVLLKDVSQFIEKEGVSSKSDIYTYLDSLGDHLCLILVDNTNELKKTTKLYKYYKNKDKVVEFTKLKGKELTQWIEGILSKNNISMSFSNINYFIQHSSYLSRNINSTLYDLENELTKVISYSKKSEINKEDIDFIMVKTLDNNIFDLLSAINKGDVDSSLSILNDIYLSNEPIQKILFMITRQIRLMLGNNIYKEKGYTDGEISDKLQIKSYEYSKIAYQARAFTIKELEGYMNLLLSVDKKLKTSSVDEKIEMEILLVKLSKKI